MLGIEDLTLNNDFMSRKSTCQGVFIEDGTSVNPNTISIIPLKR